jgi:hypothetical protein
MDFSTLSDPLNRPPFADGLFSLCCGHCVPASERIINGLGLLTGTENHAIRVTAFHAYHTRGALRAQHPGKESFQRFARTHVNGKLIRTCMHRSIAQVCC